MENIKLGKHWIEFNNTTSLPGYYTVEEMMSNKYVSISDKKNNLIHLNNGAVMKLFCLTNLLKYQLATLKTVHVTQ